MNRTSRFYASCLLCLALLLVSGCGSKALIETAKNDLRDFSSAANPKDYLDSKQKDGFKAWKKTAKKGLPEGEVLFGLCYAYGINVRENKAEAVKWFRKAAEQGLAEGQYQLGRCIFYGEGIPEDKGEGIKWIFRAKEQGHQEADALMQVAKGSPQTEATEVAKNASLNDDMNIAKEDLREFQNVFRDTDSTLNVEKYLDTKKNNFVVWQRAAERGSSEGQVLFGLCHYNGAGVPENKTEAANWYRKSAEQGLADAQLQFSMCYMSGTGIPKDMAQGAIWARKAAEQGHANAQLLLGAYYATTEGNIEEGLRWIRMAEEQGSAMASAVRQQMEKASVPVAVKGDTPKDNIGVLREAAEGGYAEAQFRLGNCYFYGIGVSDNKSEAIKWFREAAERWHEQAIDKLESIK